MFPCKMAYFHNKHFLPIVIFLFSLSFGLSFINEGLFHFDSVVLAQAVENTYRTGMLQPAVNGRYGAVLINSILYFPFFLAGQNADLVTRLSSVLFHALSVVAFFYFIRSVFNHQFQATIGALLLLFTPLYLMPNTYGKEHGMSIFFLLVSFSLLQNGIRNSSRSQFFWASVCFAFTMNVRESLIWTFPLFMLFYFQPDVSFKPFEILLKKDQRNHKNLLSFFAPLLILVGLTFIFHLIGVIQAYYLNGIFCPTFKHALKDIATSLPFAGQFLLLLGIWKMAWRERKFILAFFLLWLSLIALYGNTIWYAPRHLDSVLIPFWIFVSYAIRCFYEKSRMVAVAITVYLIFQMFIFAYPILELRRTFNGEKRFAEFVQSRTEPNAVIATQDQGYFIDYYSHRKWLVFPLQGNKNAVESFIQQVKTYLSRGIPIYYTNASFSKDYERFSDGRISRAFKITPVGEAWREDYHRAEIFLRLSKQTLYRVSEK